MRIIKRARLVEFWESRRFDSRDAEKYLSAWYGIARRVAWTNFGHLKQTFGTADVVGNCVVFDVGNNRYRLIGRINYRIGVIYILMVMDHADYDKGRWVDECGCHQPPPVASGAKGRGQK